MPDLVKAIETAQGKADHMARMTDQSLILDGGPVSFLVTFSIESGHPAGTCRHLSMSVYLPGKLPSPEAVWMVAELFGFAGGLSACTIWLEDLKGHDKAVNIVQPLPS